MCVCMSVRMHVAHARACALCQSVCLSACLCVCLGVCECARVLCMGACASHHPFARLSINLSVRPSVGMRVRARVVCARVVYK